MSDPVRLSVDLILKGGNVGRPKDPRLSRRALTTIHAMGPRFDHADDPEAALLAEIDDDDKPDERGMIAALWPHDEYSVWPMVHHAGQLVPVILDRDLRPAGNRAVNVSDGFPLVTPNRDVTLRKVDPFGTGQLLTLAAFQLVAGAYTNPGQPHEPARRERWHQGWDGDRDNPGVVDLFEAERVAGRTVVYYADTNRPGCPLANPRERRLIQVGLDVLGVIPGKGSEAVKVRCLSRGTEPSPVDGHVFPWANLRLTP